MNRYYEEDLTEDEIAYNKYLKGEYTYDDYCNVCNTEEVEPLAPITKSDTQKKYIIDITDDKNYIIKNVESGLELKVAKSVNNLESIIKMVGQENIKDIIDNDSKR